MSSDLQVSPLLAALKQSWSRWQASKQTPAAAHTPLRHSAPLVQCVPARPAPTGAVAEPAHVLRAPGRRTAGSSASPSARPCTAAAAPRPARRSARRSACRTSPSAARNSCWRSSRPTGTRGRRRTCRPRSDRWRRCRRTCADRPCSVPIGPDKSSDHAGEIEGHAGEIAGARAATPAAAAGVVGVVGGAARRAQDAQRSDGRQSLHASRIALHPQPPQATRHQPVTNAPGNRRPMPCIIWRRWRTTVRWSASGSSATARVKHSTPRFTTSSTSWRSPLRTAPPARARAFGAEGAPFLIVAANVRDVRRARPHRRRARLHRRLRRRGGALRERASAAVGHHGTDGSSALIRVR